MRFSMKWALAAMAYVAVAAAAFSRQTWVFADLLWAASLLAVVFAALVARFARGRRQMAGAGFVVASGCFLLCMALDQNAVPTNRLLAAAGIYAKAPVGAWATPLQPALAAPQPAPRYGAPPRVVSRQRPVTETKMTDKGPVSETRVVTEEVVDTFVDPASASVYPLAPASPSPARYYPPTSVAIPMAPFGNWMSNTDSTMYLYRSGRAVGMMGFGLLGCLVGLMAHKAVRSNLDHCVA